MECCDPPLSRMPKGELLNHLKTVGLGMELSGRVLVWRV